MNSAALREHLRQLFAEVDTDNNGCLGRSEFGELCTKIGLSAEAANETFDRLDVDKNDRITFEEFAAGFNQCKQTSASSNATATPPTTTSPSAGRSPSAAAAPTSRPSSSSNNSQQAASRPPAPPAAANQASKSPLAGRHQQKGAASFATAGSSLAARSARKGASPLGLLSLGSGGSSSSTNLTTSGGGGGANNNNNRSGSTGADLSSDFNSADGDYAVLGATGSATIGNKSNNGDPMVVYSSDQIVLNDSYDQASGSSQFGSLMSGSGSLRNVQDVLEVVQKLQNENQILTQLFVKDKREREEYISQLGEEFDQQVREVEERANRRAREEWELEKKRLMDRMQAERETLQHHYQTIEKMSKLIKSSNGKLTTDENESIDKVKSRLEDTYMENRQLKKSLLDTKTDVAMIWKEMERLKCQYEDKLSSAYERNNETRSECDHIKQQLTLMKDSNRKLQDASDVITNYITDKVEPVIKGAGGADGSDVDANYLSPHNHLGVGGGLSGSSSRLNSQANSRRGSILSEYLNGHQSNSIDGYEPSMNSADLESIGDTSLGSQGRHLKKAELEERLSAAAGSGQLGAPPRPKPRGSLESSSSTSRDRAESTSSRGKQQSSSKQQLDDHQTGGLMEVGQQRRRQQPSSDLKKSSSSIAAASASGKSVNHANGANDDNSNQASVSLEDRNQIIKKKEKLDEKKSIESSNSSRSSGGFRNIGRHFFIGSRTQSDAQLQAKDSKTSADGVSPSNSSNEVALAAAAAKLANRSASADHVDDQSTIEPADGPSKATFNIILVGDSFVGKSSFAARFMEGSFVQGLISNCSIDFKTKAYKVDGTNYTVNLWDTAGQERFRSITASYFRKADGIILMYDVTEKRSYLNVRNWMSTISDTAAENVAVLLVGNKIDLRQKQNKDNCVPTEEGFRLAKEYDIVFLETSVKTGMNLNPSMGKLIRLIAKNNCPDEEDKDRIRLNDKSRTFNCMPKNC